MWPHSIGLGASINTNHWKIGWVGMGMIQSGSVLALTVGLRRTHRLSTCLGTMSIFVFACLRHGRREGLSTSPWTVAWNGGLPIVHIDSLAAALAIPNL